VIWSMGALALHEHVERLLKVDFLTKDAAPESLHRYMRPALEIFMHGLLAEGAFQRLATFLGDDAAQETPRSSYDSNESGSDVGVSCIRCPWSSQGLWHRTCLRQSGPWGRTGCSASFSRPDWWREDPGHPGYAGLVACRFRHRGRLGGRCLARRRGHTP